MGFHQKENGFWNSEFQSVGFENIHEISTPCRGRRAIHPRRYCGGAAVISNSTKHKIYYSIAPRRR